MKDRFVDIAFQAFIHTVQIGSTVEVLSADEVYQKKYVIARPYNCLNKVHYVINPNKLLGEYCLITNYDEFIEVMNYIINDLMLVESEWQIERFDFAIHTTYDYDSLFKLNCYLTDLFACMSNCDNNYMVFDHRLRNRTTVIKNNYYELEVYNKHIESGCKAWPVTRCEFRYKSLAKSKSKTWGQIIDSCIAKATRFLESAPSFIPLIDESMLKCLRQKYVEYSKSAHCKEPRLFGYFVARYNGFIYNRKILKSLYSTVCTGSFKDWFHRFNKHSVNIDLISTADVTNYCMLLSNAISAYKLSLNPRLLIPAQLQEIA